jgi:hypothetical protein
MIFKRGNKSLIGAEILDRRRRKPAEVGPPMLGAVEAWQRDGLPMAGQPADVRR